MLDLNKDLADQKATELLKAKADEVKKAIEAVKNDFESIHININCAGVGASSRTVGTYARAGFLRLV